MATHLVQKPGESTWYVRIAVPLDVRHAFGGRSKLIKTTGTSNKVEALDRRLPILALWKAQIKAAREGTPMPADWQDNFITRLQGIDQLVTKTQTDAMQGVEVATTEPTDQELDAFKKLGPEVISVLADIYRVRQQQPRGEFRFMEDLGQVSKLIAKVQLTSGYHVTPEQEAEADGLIANTASYKPVSPITPARLKSFRAYREKTNVAAKTIDQQESKLDKLSTYIREQGKPLVKETVASWVESLPLTSKTKIQYLLAGATFWKWAIKHDARWLENFDPKENPFTGHELPKLRPDEKAATKRKAYALDQLTGIYNAARANGQETLCDIIMLGYYTGARIEELAKLRSESIIMVEGVRLIDIDKAKSYAGIRQVPVHPLLSPVIDRLIESSTDGYLLHSSGGNQYGTRSDNISKAFGRLKTSLGYGRQHVFHSIRGTTITQLLRSGVPGTTVANIVGHETGLVTFDVYDEGASPKQKLEAISKLPTALTTPVHR
ncbi:tyrosine-type recombinase/integrase [Pseudomonas sp. CCC2.2]|uniref:tyrosine-type recombinase/integrase n=1 Tax=Pseudomonas sp. CCC2.2 TaxID=3048605 RepID=UPI002B234DAA|nr:tyrosine-type recombinase/integrase [Pseudomonas sp. CCC2.2]MEB0150328.1 tyrosine-type recombinase/integrase [Pseudomonas sp. CCC2.2]